MTQTAILLGANAENAAKELEHVVMFEKKLADVSENSIFIFSFSLFLYVLLFVCEVCNYSL